MGGRTTRLVCTLSELCKSRAVFSPSLQIYCAQSEIPVVRNVQNLREPCGNCAQLSEHWGKKAAGYKGEKMLFCRKTKIGPDVRGGEGEYEEYRYAFYRSNVILIFCIHTGTTVYCMHNRVGQFFRI